ncbi:MAG: pyruvate dehydrogenase (acetyl-transferring) E1 component subunit alpha [Nanoarchaeota archaeon]
MPEDKTGEFSIKHTSILDENGNVDSKLMPNISDDDTRTMYWHMNLARVLNDKMLNLQKQGRLGTFASVRGQEGSQAAAIQAIKGINNIWITPTFRENAALVARGVPLVQILKYWGGYEAGSKVDASLNVLPVNIALGSQLTHAVGLGMAMNIKKEKGAAIAFFGDGATSEGEAHEAMNFAGVFKTPTIFFCQNNQYAISVPRAKQTAAKTLAQKAIAYGFEGLQVDGNDVFAVYKAVKEAVEKAMRGDGPTFIEALTYRLDNHTTADDWKKYRSEAEVQEWQKRDPIPRLRKYMISKEIWNEEQEKAMLADATKKVEEAVQAYEATPKPNPGEMFDYTYEKLPADLQEQKEQFMKFWGAK